MELKIKFEESKNEIGFKPSFDELDYLFNLKDSVLNLGFVPEYFSRHLKRVIADYINHSQEYLLGLVFPNSNSIISII